MSLFELKLDDNIALYLTDKFKFAQKLDDSYLIIGALGFQQYLVDPSYFKNPEELTFCCDMSYEFTNEKFDAEDVKSLFIDNAINDIDYALNGINRNNK